MVRGVWVLYSERIELKRRKSSAYGVMFMPFGKHIWEVVK